MKTKRLIIILILFISISGYSQIKNFETIEKYVKEVPKSETENIESLSLYLKKNAKTKTEIVARIYFWMVENIQYDWDAFRNNKQIDVSAIATLQNRKSVCAGYANLFEAICSKINVKCAVINGYAKGYGYNGERLTEPNHAWNAVKIYDKWELIDVTWGRKSILTKEGEEELWDARYFLDDSKDFILEHFPIDDGWQLLEDGISIDDFFGAEMEEKRKRRSSQTTAIEELIIEQ